MQCGFPSPAEDFQQERLNLLDLVVRQAEATFFMRVRGASMCDAGIDDGDYVVIDRSIQAQHDHIILAVLDGEFTIKHLYQRGGRTILQALQLHTAADLALVNPRVLRDRFSIVLSKKAQELAGVSCLHAQTFFVMTLLTRALPHIIFLTRPATPTLLPKPYGPL